MQRHLFASVLAGALVFSSLPPLLAQTPAQSLVSSTQVINPILKLIDNVAVPTEVSGTIEAMHVQEGSVLIVGQPIATIRSHALRMQLRRAELDRNTAAYRAENDIEIRDAEKSLAVAKTELERVLNANRRVPETFIQGEVDRYQLLVDRATLAVERAQFEQKLAQSALELAEHEVVSAKELLSRYTITAPIDGTVSTTLAQRGEWLEIGQTIAEVVSTTKLRVEGFLHSDAIPLAQPGAQARIKILSSPKQWIETMGTLTFISPDVNPINSQTRVFLEFDNSNLGLSPGLKVEANIVTTSIP
jgi:multidrug efflux pump subunit AcrA (membrane-fusion protein)